MVIVMKPARKEDITGVEKLLKAWVLTSTFLKVRTHHNRCHRRQTSAGRHTAGTPSRC